MNDTNAIELIKAECKAFFHDKEAYKDQIIVFGEGNPSACLMLIGEAPGEQEVVKQRPFVGKAGENLNRFLNILEIDRENIYITNVVKFRPTKEKLEGNNSKRLSNRPPNAEEIELCRSWLYKEIETVKPKVIVTLGNVALKTIIGDERAVIGQMHGKPAEINVKNIYKTMLFPLYHPASIIYNRALEEIYISDVVKLKLFLEDKSCFLT